MAFPVTDNFNRTGSNPIGSNWTQMNTFYGTLSIDATGTYCVGGGTSGVLFIQASWAADSPNADQYSQITLASWGAIWSQYSGVVVRASGTNPSGSDTRTFYSFCASDNGANSPWYVHKCINGTLTQLDTGNRTFTGGDLLRLEVEGTTLRAYHAGNLISTLTGQTDISAAGSMGILCGGNVGVDNFEGGNLAVAATLDQYAFRFRNDDGSETTATWKATQNTNISEVVEALRLRIGLQATGDPAAAAYQLEWQRVAEGIWRKVV